MNPPQASVFYIVLFINMRHHSALMLLSAGILHQCCKGEHVDAVITGNVAVQGLRGLDHAESAEVGWTMLSAI